MLFGCIRVKRTLQVAVENLNRPFYTFNKHKKEKPMKYLTILILLLSFIACATAPRSTSGVYRPSLGTMRNSYIAQFPVNKATKQEILDFVGAPDKVYTSNDIEYLTYIISDDAYGKIEYTYFIKDNLVIDVKMINNFVLSTEILQHSQIKK